MKFSKSAIAGGLLLIAAVLVFLHQKTKAPVGSPSELGKIESPAKKPLLAASEQKPALAEASAPLSSSASADLGLTKDLITAKILEATVTYDAKELPKIRVFLDHDDPEVRRAAMEGMINLGDSSAGPMLREASKTARTPQEAVALEEAATFIELPPSRNFRLRKKGEAEKK